MIEIVGFKLILPNFMHLNKLYQDLKLLSNTLNFQIIKKN